MLDVRKTELFDRWLSSLRHVQAQSVIARRLRLLASGHFGDAKALGKGLFELRIHVGPGYRVYLARRGDAVIVLLCGGDKDSQRRDIALAFELAARLEE